MKLLPIVLTILIFIISCKSENIRNEEVKVIENNVQKSNDSIVHFEKNEQKITRDKSFRAFLNKAQFNFNYFQKRINIPLIIERPNEITEISDLKNESISLRYYTNEPYFPYIMFNESNLFENEIATKGKVVLTRVNRNTETFESFFFENNDSIWLLKKIKEDNLSSINEFNNFLEFLEKFSTDSSYQIQRIVFPLHYKFVDSDNDYKFDNKTINKGDWSYVNIISKLEILLIVDYEFDNLNKVQESILIYFGGIECGISVEYLFKRIGNSWYLTNMNDLST